MRLMTTRAFLLAIILFFWFGETKSQYLISAVDLFNTSIHSEFNANQSFFTSANGNLYELSKLEDGSLGRTQTYEILSIRLMSNIWKNIFVNINLSTATSQESYFGVLYPNKFFNGSGYDYGQGYSEVKIVNEYFGYGFELMYKFGKQVNAPFLTAEASGFLMNITENFYPYNLDGDKTNTEFEGWLYQPKSDWRFNVGAAYRYRNFMLHAKYWLPYVPENKELGISNSRVDVGLTYLVRTIPFRKQNKLYLGE